MTDLLPRVEAMLRGIVEEKVRDATGDIEAKWKERWLATCADRDQAVRMAQALREQVQALELKLLEVRKVAELGPAMPLEVGGFRVGDLVRPLHACGAFVQVRQLWNGVVLTRTSAWCPGDLERKPVEVGDRVRIVAGNATCIGMTFVVTRVMPDGTVWGPEGEGAWHPANLVTIAK